MPRPDFYAFKIPASHCILLTNDGSELTQKVFLKLKTAGNQVAILNLPNIPNPIKVNAVNLAETTDLAIKEAIEKIRKDYGEIGSFIHLHPQFEFQKGHFTQHFQAEKAVVKTIFFLAKHLQKPLNELGEKQRANFLTVTRMDGKLGQGNPGNVSIIGGGLTGLVKCVNLEWSPVFCRAVDIQPSLSVDQISEDIIGEFHDANLNYTEVAISEEGRKTTVVTELKLANHQQIKTKVTANSVFLVSGGARGVTAKCVIEMAKAFQCKFILLGRSDFSFQVPAFAKTVDNESELKRLIMTDLKNRGEKPSLPLVKKIFKNIVAKKEIEETISAIENHSGRVEYLKGDVTNFGSYKDGLKSITAKFGNITGVIHGAGRLADKYIQDKTESDFENVLAVKLDGLLSLLQSVNIHKLEHLILFSSVAGFYGNVGQTDYAIANEILSKAAHLFKKNHPNTHVSAINWGAWDSGMVSGELKAQFEAMGVVLVNSEGGPAMLVNELNTEYANQPQCIIGGTLPAGVSHIGDLRKHQIKRILKLEENPFLNDHVIHGNPVMPVVNAVSWTAQTCQNLYPDFKILKVEDCKLFKGLVFDGKQMEEYLIDVEETSKTAEEIIFSVKVTSKTPTRKLPDFHYKSTVTLRHKTKLPAVPKITVPDLGKETPKNGTTFYQDGTLFHGKSYQGIEQLFYAKETDMLMSCKAPAIPLSTQGQFAAKAVNPYYIDILYQGFIIWLDKFKDGAKGLPVSTKSVTLYKDIQFDERLFSTIEVEKVDDFKLVATCKVFDEEGNLYLETKGGTMTISKDLVW